MTTPKKPTVNMRLRVQAQDAIITGIIGAEGHALIEGKEELAAAIRDIGGSIADRFKTELPERKAAAKVEPHPITLSGGAPVDLTKRTA